jgi:dephospho-CoA kinase
MGLLVGLTGGIASGKSTVSQILATENIPVIDTDLISRELLEPDQPCFDAVIHRFGPDILNPDGRLNRTALREKVFADPSAREALETILHPEIRRLAKERAERASTQAPYVLIVVPLLADPKVHPHYRWLDHVVGVRASPSIQKARLIERPAINASLADQIIAAQNSDHERDAIVDEWIENTDDLATLTHRVMQCHHRLLTLATAQQRSE